MKILDIMLDLETLGKNNSPVITQLSSVPFNIETCEIFPEEFNQYISPMSSVKYNLEIEGDTISWWLTQDKEAVEKVIVKSIQEGLALPEVLINFNNYINDLKKKYDVKEVRLWGNGQLSDIKWLESSYLKTNIKPAWNFRETSCVRVLVDLGRRFLGIDPKESTVFIGLKHYAIDDCKHQIKYCCEITKKLKEMITK